MSPKAKRPGASATPRNEAPMKYQTRCEVESPSLCKELAIGILVWKKSELTLAVCQPHADRVNSNKCELKRFDAKLTPSTPKGD